MLIIVHPTMESEESSINEVQFISAFSSFPSSYLVKLWRYFKLKVFQYISGLTCLLVFTFLFVNIFCQYRREDSTTITEFVDISEVSKDIKVKICNNVFLDPQKILNYNGTDLKPESFNFLLQSLTETHSSNENSDWRHFSALTVDKFVLSSRIMETFRLDLDKFMISCYVGHSEYSCLHLFRPVIDNFMVCYEAVIDAVSVGLHYSIGIALYFNPDIKFGKYTSTWGSIVSVSHPEEFVEPEENGLYVLSNELAIISASVTHRIQTQSFKRSPCVDKYGSVEYNFTGIPFHVAYDRSTCLQACHSQLFYAGCKCSPFTAFNITNTECLEQRENWDCVYEFGRSKEKNEDMMQCGSKCFPKCEQKFLSLKTQKKIITLETNKQSDAAFEVYLKYMIEHKNASVLAVNLLEKLESGTVKNISKNFAYVQISMRSDPVTVLRVEPKESISTFLSNAGGLLGMWLGVSALSFLNFIENVFLKTLLTHKKDEEKEKREKEEEEEEIAYEMAVKRDAKIESKKITEDMLGRNIGAEKNEPKF